MTNYLQLEILKNGVAAWNEWRNENPQTKIEFESADLWRANLNGAILSNANLSGANLRDADLSETFLHGANLSGAVLSGANLNKADLRDANLYQAVLFQADLSKANLLHTNLTGTNLSQANLRGAILNSANLRETNLRGASLDNSDVGDTVFARIDLSETNGIKNVNHNFPSTVSTDTIQLSKGKIPDNFLRGCGLSDVDIEYAKLSNPDLSNEEINKILYRLYDLRANQAIQISPLFISYSHGDSKFVNRVESHLIEKGIRYWRDIHDLKAGRIEKQIDSAISQGKTVLLVLSESSLASDWVEHEVRTARQLENDLERDILCPVALDDSWKSSRWPKRVMEQIMEYNILDFSAWEDDVQFEGMFRKLIDGLELFYKG
jgi:uncharacterized protein YjbI with pentapeptide repeats